jgi:PAS domain-containing protein
MQLSSIRSSLSLAFDQAAEQLRQWLGAFPEIRFVVVEKHRTLQKVLCEPENRLLKVLATFFDAIVVIEDERSILDANQRALTLLGIVRKYHILTSLRSILSCRTITFRFSYKMVHPSSGEEGAAANVRSRGFMAVGRKRNFHFQANFTRGRYLCRFRDLAFEKPVTNWLTWGLRTALRGEEFSLTMSEEQGSTKLQKSALSSKRRVRWQTVLSS